jgi:hypothetical protein
MSAPLNSFVVRPSGGSLYHLLSWFDDTNFRLKAVLQTFIFVAFYLPIHPPSTTKTRQCQFVRTTNLHLRRILPSHPPAIHNQNVSLNVIAGGR